MRRLSSSGRPRPTAVVFALRLAPLTAGVAACLSSSGSHGCDNEPCTPGEVVTCECPASQEVAGYSGAGICPASGMWLCAYSCSDAPCCAPGFSPTPVAGNVAINCEAGPQGLSGMLCCPSDYGHNCPPGKDGGVGGDANADIPTSPFECEVNGGFCGACGPYSMVASYNCGDSGAQCCFERRVSDEADVNASRAADADSEEHESGQSD
jgi:hypothetical protein